MPYLIIATLIWSFSFSLIGGYLSGQVDNWFSILTRVTLAFLLFAPFLKLHQVKLKQSFMFMAAGACQLGIMYFFYYASFDYLSVTEVLLFGITMPVYITFCYDLLSRNKIRLGYLLSAMLAVIGSAVINYQRPGDSFGIGLLLIQIANVFFALGQVGYKKAMEIAPLPPKTAMAWFYVGAIGVAIIGWCLFGETTKLPTTITQWSIIVWLGFGASGLGYFMWNYGAGKVDAGTLAIMNNMMIPTGLVINLLLWQESIDWLRLLVGGGIIIAALFIHNYWITDKRVASE